MKSYCFRAWSTWQLYNSGKQADTIFGISCTPEIAEETYLELLKTNAVAEYVRI